LGPGEPTLFRAKRHFQQSVGVSEETRPGPAGEGDGGQVHILEVAEKLGGHFGVDPRQEEAEASLVSTAKNLH